MNKLLNLAAFQSHLVPLLIGASLSGWILLAVGCGGDDSPEGITVSPPDPAEPAGGDAGSEVADAPGGIELPAGGEEVERPSGGGGLELPAGDDLPDREESNSQESNGGGGIEMPANVEIPESSSSESPVNPAVRYATWEAIQQEVTSNGKVTVVDLWSLTCEPCLKEFPGLVQLHKTYGAKVRCVAVDLDYDGRKSRPPNFYEERVIAFLESVQASGFPIFISETPSDDVFAATKLISIPAVLIYDESGTLVKSFVDAGPDAGFSYQEDVVPYVEQLAIN
ncbi:MAG: TlpA family protein disulfide reductase [Planctomycetaceae bacterium]|jgi:thiol-disulfide isomerase/thioredoxin|nr:TlpA family protein disulfide reductase [Planctomycetaceae bacterium]